jgi:CheY-like chemotaxis protein
VATAVPYEVAGKKTTQVVVAYQGKRSPPVSLAVTASAPALFTLDALGKGQAAMLNETGCCNSVRNPAVRGTVASLYATGGGRIAPGPVARNISVTVGGVPAEVLYTGNGSSMQVNFRVPANAPVGDTVPLVLKVGNRRSSPDVTMAVRSARQRVLVVDDDATIRNGLARILGGAGYEVTTVAKEQPDLAIFDLAMPQEKNLETIRTIREVHPQLKIVAISAAVGPDALRAADILGAQAVLPLPLNAATVLSRVRTLLQRRPAVY